MLSKTNQQEKITLKALFLSIITLYIFVCLFSLIAVYQTQNNQHNTLEALKLNDQQLHNLASAPVMYSSIIGKLVMKKQVN